MQQVHFRRLVLLRPHGGEEEVEFAVGTGGVWVRRVIREVIRQITFLV